ncbi:MAG: hypothetical protein AB1305_06025, partial [Candidatus Hadarchaeota archaeon]
MKGAIVTLVENVPLKFDGVIKSVKTGRWNIEAAVAGPGIVSPGKVAINVSVSENSAQVYDGYYWPGTENAQHEVPASPRLPIDVSLAFITRPSFDNAGLLRCTVEAAENVENVVAKVDLPEGLALVSGDTSWRGNLLGGSAVTFDVRVKIAKQGYWEAKADVSDNQFRNYDIIYLQISENGVVVSKVPPLIGTETKSEISSIGSQYLSFKLPSENSLTVRGQLDYLNEVGIRRPRQGATVKIYDVYSSIFGPKERELGSVQTDDRGFFTFVTHEVDPVWEEPGLDIRVKVFVENDAVKVERPGGGTYAAYIQSPDPDGITFWNRDGVLDVGSGWLPFSGHEGAWRIFARINEARNYLKDGPAKYVVPKVTVYWPAGSSQYSPAGRYIDITQAGDNLPDQIRHEYGHFVMNQVYDWFPPNPLPADHSMWTAYASKSGVWAEGWATFFALAVEDDGIWIGNNIENQHLADGFPTGDAVEGRVAGALYDIYDVNVDRFWRDIPNYDHISAGFEPIWTVFKSGKFNTFADFWNAFKSMYGTDASRVHLAKMALFQNTIDYNSKPSTRLTVSGVNPITLSASVADDPEDLPFIKVRFERLSDDGMSWPQVGEDSAAPYSLSWNAPSPTPRHVRAEADDGMEVSYHDARIYDFSTGAGIDRRAWQWGGMQSPFNLGSPATVNPDDNQYGKIASSDGDWWETGAAPAYSYDTQMYRFRLQEPLIGIDRIDGFWEGFGEGVLKY